jgi:hypothetical protein
MGGCALPRSECNDHKEMVGKGAKSARAVVSDCPGTAEGSARRRQQRAQTPEIANIARLSHSQRDQCDRSFPHFRHIRRCQDRRAGRTVPLFPFFLDSPRLFVDGPGFLLYPHVNLACDRLGWGEGFPS